MLLLIKLPLTIVQPFAAVKKIHITYKIKENYVAYKINRAVHDVIMKGCK